MLIILEYNGFRLLIHCLFPGYSFRSGELNRGKEWHISPHGLVDDDPGDKDDSPNNAAD